MPRRLTFTDMTRLATKCGLVYQGSQTPKSTKKEPWLCVRGHVWMARPNSVRSGSNCVHCFNEDKRLTIDDMHAVAVQRGFKCLSSVYEGAFSHLKWECGANHTWSATPNAIKNGKGCPHCAGNARLTLQDMHQIACLRGFVYLGSPTPKASQPEPWQCAEAHIWQASYNNINDGNGCPHCYHNRRYHILKMRSSQPSPLSP